jgi:hypothetical protein
VPLYYMRGFTNFTDTILFILLCSIVARMSGVSALALVSSSALSCRSMMVMGSSSSSSRILWSSSLPATAGNGLDEGLAIRRGLATMTSATAMSAKSLKELCKMNNLTVSGKKTDLIQRLTDAGCDLEGSGDEGGSNNAIVHAKLPHNSIFISACKS